MLKKALIILIALLALSGCKKGDTNIADPDASPVVSDPAASPVISAEPLKPAEVPGGKDDPTRTANIPETADPNKVQATTPEKTAGSGLRGDEVSDKTVKATSADNAVILTQQYLKKNNIYIPSNIEVDREDDDYYYMHAYEEIKDGDVSHTATVGWYNVSKKDSSVVTADADIKVGERPDTYDQ